MVVNPDGLSDARALEYERAYFERGFMAAYAWCVTKRDAERLADAVVDHAWEHRDEGMSGDDILPIITPPASTSTAIAAGVVMVPVEATEAMIEAGRQEARVWLTPSQNTDAIWSAMRAAAPKAASEDGATGLQEALRKSLAKRSQPTMDPPWSAAFNAALDMVARDVAPFLAAPPTDATEAERKRIIAEARKNLRLAQGCMECNAEDERRWMDTILWLEELA